MTNLVQNTQITWDEALIRRYDLSGPRYTSYPTAVEFSSTFNNAEMHAAATASSNSERPLSLYTHLPFCAHLCYYCACNKVITKKREKAKPYVERLLQEARLQAALFGAHRPVEQLHWGGGTPTFLPPDIMRMLMQGYAEIFNLQRHDKRDYSIEIDPREMLDDTLETLWELGFNRISLGVQDIDENVQKAVHRIQPKALTANLLQQARAIGFRSINLDLIYGLPLQTANSFAATLEEVIELNPDRLSIFSYAHLPERFFPQTRIKSEDLPAPSEKLDILHQSIETLLQAGYEYIGMDHFAKPNDSLAIAQKQGKLHRNFQGYTTHGDCDLVSLGVSSIGQTQNAYFQSSHDMNVWEESIDNHKLAIIRGIKLTEDDHIRRWVIGKLICQFALDKQQFKQQWQVDFDVYFADEHQRLKPMLTDKLLTDSPTQIQILPAGRLLIRAICQIFDAYRKDTASKRFSRII